MSITANQFSEAELNRASIAGISKEALAVAKEYPQSPFGLELRNHFEWGKIDDMARERREKGEDATPSDHWLGGGFSTALAFMDLQVAYAFADPRNERILIDVHGVPEDVNIVKESTIAAVETHGLTPTGELDTGDDGKAGEVGA